MENRFKKEIESIFLRHYREWCLLSYSYLGSMDEAEDIVQDIFVNVLLKKQETKILNLKGYISTAVKNASLKRIRRTRHIDRGTENNREFSASHEEQMIDLENRIKVQRAIASLPEKRKKVFELCVLDGCKYEKAAVSLGISVNTVKFHLKKAYKDLRVSLGDPFFIVFLILQYYFF